MDEKDLVIMQVERERDVAVESLKAMRERYDALYKRLQEEQERRLATCAVHWAIEDEAVKWRSRYQQIRLEFARQKGAELNGGEVDAADLIARYKKLAETALRKNTELGMHIKRLERQLRIEHKARQVAMDEAVFLQDEAKMCAYKVEQGRRTLHVVKRILKQHSALNPECEVFTLALVAVQINLTEIQQQLGTIVWKSPVKAED